MEDDTEDELEDQVFTIHGEQEEEKLDLTVQNTLASYRELYSRQSGSLPPGPDLEKSSSPTAASSDPTEAIDVLSESSPLRRWAIYPGTYFSSSLLPVYNGSRLPAIVPVHELSSTFTEGRQRLWEKIVSGTTAASTTGQSSVPPWRLPNVFLSSDWAVGSDAPPPPPSVAPPPLPPLPPGLSSSKYDITKTAVNIDTEPTAAQLLSVGDVDPSVDEIDMDISDSE
ncbi:hypothetical protein EIP86_011537 [Pleurotus ostreatoroseus]|nr:hypothetical protein EIP86_011537 [Pleurotus ostreatoroseus]